MGFDFVPPILISQSSRLVNVLLRWVNGFLPLGNVQLRVGNDILRVGLVLMWGGNVLMHLGLVQIRLGLVQIRLGNDLTRRINSFYIMLNHLSQSKSCSRPATGRLRGGKDDSGWARTPCAPLLGKSHVRWAADCLPHRVCRLKSSIY